MRAVSRVLAILRAFEGAGALSLGEVAKIADLDKGTARRLLLTLMEERFVYQDAQTQRYGLGDGIRSLAAAAPADEPDAPDTPAEATAEPEAVAVDEVSEHPGAPAA